MITSNEIKEKALKKYNEYLTSIIEQKNIFPIDIRFKKITPGDVLKKFSELDKWITALKKDSTELKNFGYTIEYDVVNNRQVGKQSFPVKIYFKSDDDYILFIEKQNETEIFKKTATEVLNRYPNLNDWICRFPEKVILIADKLEELLKVCDYFIANPKPNIYIREITAGVHSKFIEKNKPILRELLDVLIAEHVNINASDFENRFNLKTVEPLIRMKVLDDDLSKKCFSGLTDLSMPLSEFSFLQFDVKNCIILENKTNFSNIFNFLTLPHLKKTIAIFGKGFSVSLLNNVKWLENVKIFYWGDIDPHGFLILSNLRKILPQTKSFCMNKKTFDVFSDFAVEGETLFTPEKLQLTIEEYDLFIKLNETGIKNRLEQEFIECNFVTEELRLLFE